MGWHKPPQGSRLFTRAKCKSVREYLSLSLPFFYNSIFAGTVRESPSITNLSYLGSLYVSHKSWIKQIIPLHHACRHATRYNSHTERKEKKRPVYIYIKSWKNLQYWKRWLCKQFHNQSAIIHNSWYRPLSVFPTLRPRTPIPSSLNNCDFSRSSWLFVSRDL